MLRQPSFSSQLFNPLTYILINGRHTIEVWFLCHILSLARMPNFVLALWLQNSYNFSMPSEKQRRCFICGKRLRVWNTSLMKHKGFKVCSSCSWKLSKEKMKVENKPKKISETRVTCLSCGNVWHYGKTEEFENLSGNLSNLGRSMMCCSGCVPALLIPDGKVTDFDKCPKCGSRAIKKEKVVHDVK